MLFKLGLLLLFFLPVIESYNRQLGFDLLLIGSVLISFRLIWDRKIILDKINILWVVMLIAFSLSFIITLSVNRTYFEFLRYIAYFLIFISIRSFGDTKRMFNDFYLPMVIINSVTLSFLAILYTISTLHLKPLHTMTLFYPQFGHNHLADILIFALPIAIIKSIQEQNKWRKMGWITLGIFFLTFLIISVGRVALVSLSLSLFLYIFFIDKSRKWDWWGVILGISAIFLLSVIFYFSNFRTLPKTDFPLVRKLNRPFIGDFHLKNDYQALVAWQKNPILGTGLNTFRIIAGRIPPVNLDWYTHNQYLEVLSETGTMGMAAFISLFGLLIYKTINLEFKKYRKETSIELAAISIPFFASLLQSLFDYQWHFISIFLLFWMGLAIMHPATTANLKNYKLRWRLFLMILTFLFLFAFKPPFHNFRNMY